MLTETSKDRLLCICPALASLVVKMDELIPSLSIQVTQGLRTWPEQNALYQQGRTTPGNIVTYAAAGFSWHNYGMAVDLVPEDIMPGQPDWDSTHPAWQKMIATGISLGLVSGSTWSRGEKDNPHFQLTGRFPVTPNDEVRNVYLMQGGLLGVWKAAFINAPETQQMV